MKTDAPAATGASKREVRKTDHDHSIRKEEKTQVSDLVQVEAFTIGGTHSGLSMPGPRLQRMLGSRILINMEAYMLHVPTKHGWEIAQEGDRIVLWSDDSLEVEHADA